MASLRLGNYVRFHLLQAERSALTLMVKKQWPSQHRTCITSKSTSDVGNTGTSLEHDLSSSYNEQSIARLRRNLDAYSDLVEKDVKNAADSGLMKCILEDIQPNIDALTEEELVKVNQLCDVIEDSEIRRELLHIIQKALWTPEKIDDANAFTNLLKNTLYSTVSPGLLHQYHVEIRETLQKMSYQNIWLFLVWLARHKQRDMSLISLVSELLDMQSFGSQLSPGQIVKGFQALSSLSLFHQSNLIEQLCSNLHSYLDETSSMLKPKMLIEILREMGCLGWKDELLINKMLQVIIDGDLKLTDIIVIVKTLARLNIQAEGKVLDAVRSSMKQHFEKVETVPEKLKKQNLDLLVCLAILNIRVGSVKKVLNPDFYQPILKETQPGSLLRGYILSPLMALNAAVQLSGSEYDGPVLPGEYIDEVQGKPNVHARKKGAITDGVLLLVDDLSVHRVKKYVYSEAGAHADAEFMVDKSGNIYNSDDIEEMDESELTRVALVVLNFYQTIRVPVSQDLVSEGMESSHLVYLKNGKVLLSEKDGNSALRVNHLEKTGYTVVEVLQQDFPLFESLEKKKEYMKGLINKACGITVENEETGLEEEITEDKEEITANEEEITADEEEITADEEEINDEETK